MNEPLDDEFEARVRRAFHGIDDPPVAPALLSTVDRLRSQPRRGRSRAPLGRQIASVLAGVAAVAVLAVILTTSLDSGKRPSASAMSSASSAPSRSESPAPISTSGASVARQAWSGTFVPAAFATIDAGHSVVVGATGFGVGQGVVGLSSDGGLSWSLMRLSSPPLDGVAATGSTIWATVDCQPTSTSTCAATLLASTNMGDSWNVRSSEPVRSPVLIDPLHVWALGSGGAQGQPSVLETLDGGATWNERPSPCGGATPSAQVVEFISSSIGWIGCVGDAGAGSEAKAIVETKDGGRSWATLSSIAFDGSTPVGTIPGSRALVGLAMANATTGWLWTTGALFQTVDGGRIWTVSGFADASGATTVKAATRSGASSGYVLIEDSAGQRMRLLHTSDAGRHWTPLFAWPL
jgi:hypothetical protein